MPEIIKTAEEIEDLFRLVVLTILKLDPNKNNKRVRFPWGSNLKAGIGSAPAWKKEEDVCLIYELPQDDGYNRRRNRSYADQGGRDLIAVDEHTDVHYFNFVNYGPNAYEFARDIRDGLFLDETRRLLSKNNFYLVTDVPAIKRIPELWNGEWWNRADISAIFNEYVRRESTMMVIEKVPLTVTEVTSRGHTLSRKEIIERG